MKARDYKVFKNIVAGANKEADVWYDGFYWLDLTANQIKDICNILKLNSSVKETETQYVLPSGMTIKK